MRTVVAGIIGNAVIDQLEASTLLGHIVSLGTLGAVTIHIILHTIFNFSHTFPGISQVVPGHTCQTFTKLIPGLAVFINGIASPLEQDISCLAFHTVIPSLVINIGDTIWHSSNVFIAYKAESISYNITTIT